MYRLFYISSLISLTFGYLPIIPVKNYNKNFKKQEVQIYEPYELKKNETDHKICEVAPLLLWVEHKFSLN